MRLYINLFLTFMHIGAVSFGGGYAMLPMFQRELVEKKGWLTEEDMTDIFSVGQCLPGIIAGNTAVFVGYKQKGVAGGATAVIGAVFPSVVFTLILAAFIANFSDIAVVQSAFAGIRVGVSVLIINTVIKLWKQAVADKLAIVIFAVVFLVSVFTSLPTAALVFSAGIAGVGICTLRRGRAK